MSIEESNVVDFIGIDKESGAIGLLINDHLEWDAAKFPLLKNKVNAYLDYIESGQLVNHNPDYKGRDIYIELVHHFAPNPQGESVLEKIRTVSADANVQFRWSQFIEDDLAD